MNFTARSTTTASETNLRLMLSKKLKNTCLRHLLKKLTNFLKRYADLISNKHQRYTYCILNFNRQVNCLSSKNISNIKYLVLFTSFISITL